MIDNSANKHSPSYRLAMLDPDFLLSDAQRGARFMLEYEKTEHILREHGVAVRSSCEAGSCGTCRTGLVDGEAEHRDFVLGPDEQASQIMVCVSRARSASLTLDL